MFNALSRRRWRTGARPDAKEGSQAGREPRAETEVSEAARVWLFAQNDHPEWGRAPAAENHRGEHVRQPLPTRCSRRMSSRDGGEGGKRGEKRADGGR